MVIYPKKGGVEKIMEYRRSNRKNGCTTLTHTPYSVTKGRDVKSRVILTEEMKRKNPLKYLYCNIGDEL